jgi:glycosyltransferase A (GT-A) superfamily protein (DUF2064 family)
MRSLVLFARRPIEGRVQSRLSPALPAPMAAQLYRARLADSLALLRTARADERWVYWADDPSDAAGPAADAGHAPAAPGAAGDTPAIPPGVMEESQRGADPGERLAHAFSELLGLPGDESASRAERHRAVIFGTDCPWLDAGTVQRAFEALERADLVAGPARDGGFTLIGMSRACPELFAGIAWSGDAVLPRALERAKALALAHETLETLEDLVHPADLVRLVARLAVPAGPVERNLRASRTAITLEAFGLLPPG